MIRVLIRAVPPGGFWEAGKFWPASETPAEVTPEELAILKATPFLVVIELSAAATKPKAEAPDMPDPVATFDISDGKASKRKRAG